MKISKKDLDRLLYNINLHILKNETARSDDLFDLIYRSMNTMGYSDVNVAEFLGVSTMTIHRYKVKKAEEPLMWYQV